MLEGRMARWLKMKDGVNVLLQDRSEVGWYYLPDRGADPNRKYGETIPEHVHHNYLYTDEYKKSRDLRGKNAADAGQFHPREEFSGEYEKENK